MSRERCIICGKILPEGGQEVCVDCLAKKSNTEAAEELRDMADVLSITEETDTSIINSMEAIMRIANRIERKKEYMGK